MLDFYLLPAVSRKEFVTQRFGRQAEGVMGPLVKKIASYSKG